jgi:hypothetical protein
MFPRSHTLEATEAVTISLTLSAKEDGYGLHLLYSNGSTASLRLVRISNGLGSNLGVWTVNEAGGKDQHHLKVKLNDVNYLDLLSSPSQQISSCSYLHS